MVVTNDCCPPITIAEDGSISATIHKEPKRGLTHARLRGIAVSRGNRLVFVDDDNVLSPTYLEDAERLFDANPILGAFGGRISGEFENPPPAWLSPYLPNLAIIDLAQDVVSNRADDYASIPCGAGLCVRREVAELYAEKVRSNPARLALDRKGDSTLSCGDWDLVLTGVDAGWSMGRFTVLHLTHLIPASRLTYEYNRRLAHGIGLSMGALIAMRRPISWREKTWRGLRTATSFFGLHGLGYKRGMELSYQSGLFLGMCRTP